MPGNVTSELSKGTNELIKQGCPIITEGQDILIALGIAYKEDEKVKFRNKVVPGDTLLLKLQLTEPIRRGIVKMKGTAYVGDKVVVEALMMAQVAKTKK